MKKYRLLKDLPHLPKDTIITDDKFTFDVSILISNEDSMTRSGWSSLGCYPEWFEEVEEPKRGVRYLGYSTSDANCEFTLRFKWDNWDEASRYIERVAATQRVIDWMVERSAITEKKLSCHHSNMTDYQIHWVLATQSLGVDSTYTPNWAFATAIPSFKTRVSARQCIEECEKDLKIIFNVE